VKPFLWETQMNQLTPRADIHKCIGTTHDKCSHCMRKTAPEHPKQQWTIPAMTLSGKCVNFADSEKFKALYVR